MVSEKMTSETKFPLISLACHEKLLSMTQTICEDIFKLISSENTGSLTLPYNLNGEDFYSFEGFSTPISFEIYLTKDLEVDNYFFDGEYYTEDTTVGLRIQLGEFYDYYEIQRNLFEIVGHELTHYIQDEVGYTFPKPPTKNRLKYYTQPHEIEAICLGFWMASNVSYGDRYRLMSEWIKYGNHQLDEHERDLLKNRLKEYYDLEPLSKPSYQLPF